MKKIISFLLILMFFSSIYAQNSEKYFVTAKKLNVREQPIVSENNIIYQIEKGSEIYVKNIQNNWAEIEVDTEKYVSGFVSSKYISKNFPSDNKSEKEKIDWFFWLSIIGSVIILYYIISSRYERKCDTCGKWGALKKIKTEIIEKKPSNIKKTLTDTVKNSKGETVRTKTKEIVVPATKYKYKVYRQCKNCEQIYTHIETETKEN